jgi:hypothetical protein
MKIDRAFKILGVLLIAVGLAACDDAPETGYIYKMPYAGESYWYSTDCAMYGMPDKYGSRNCIMWQQTRHYNPPSWELCLTDDKDPKHRGCFDVPQDIYNKYQIGRHYPTDQ